ncbi:MAG: hypothetical protein U1E65_12695 [Myxococcota bacterium]
MMTATQPPPSRSARQGRRARESARQQSALEIEPTLKLERLAAIAIVLRTYQRGLEPGSPSPLALLAAEVRAEVQELEVAVSRRSRNEHLESQCIRRALSFLRTFGRLSALDFDLVPIEHRPDLVEWLALEYRFCFAAAGTTPRAFKVAIGRTGAR